jgi:hypothetical protein
MKYLIGSKLLGLNNNKDSDFLILSKEHDYKRVWENDEDVVYRSVEHINKFLTYDVDVQRHHPLLLFNYQLDHSIIGQDFPVYFNILEHKDKVKELLHCVVDNRLYNFNKRITLNKLYCCKNLYHFAYNLFILMNNSTQLTEEQKEIIQKIHDGLMPISYIDEMKTMLNNLDETGGDTNGEEIADK